MKQEPCPRVLRHWNAANIDNPLRFEQEKLQDETANVQPKTAKPERRPFQVTTGQYRFERVTQLLRGLAEPLTVEQIAGALGVTRRDAEIMAERAMRAGRIRKLGDFETSRYASLHGPGFRSIEPEER